MGGFDTADFIQSAWPSAQPKYGAPDFWMRYLEPCNTTPVTTSLNNARLECATAWDSGGPSLGVITVPTPQSSGNYSGQANGHADAQAFCASIQQLLNQVGALKYGVRNIWVTFDLEPNHEISVDYWNAWIDYVEFFNVNNDSSYPLYGVMYVQFCNSQSACYNIKNSTDAEQPLGYWSALPLSTTHSIHNPPAWNPQGCSDCGRQSSRGADIVAWQFADAGLNIPLSDDVDLNTNEPGVTISAHLFNVSYRPQT